MLTQRQQDSRRTARQKRPAGVSSVREPGPGLAGPRPPGLMFYVAIAAFYLAVAVAATWPFALSFATHLPTKGDPSQHVWIMRWYKSCLMQGRSPFFCPEIQHPVGAPFGFFSPLHIQSIFYIIASFFIKNDIICYNLIWLAGLVSTGLCVFAAAWRVTRDRASAAMGGLLGMLSAPVMLHAHAHLELHFLGAFALFLVVWHRFLDRPSRGRLAAAVALYFTMTACAAYFAVLAVPAAVWAVVWQAARRGRSGAGDWLRGRSRWLAGFAALSIPGLLLLLSSQVWSAAHGFRMSRSLLEFELLGSSLWCYVVPTKLHALGRALPFDIYAAAGNTGARGYWVIEKSSYLGVVTLALLFYSAVCRVRFRRSGLWWSTLAVLVVLSLGAYLQVGSFRVSLPCLWLWRYGLIFRLIRAPARFNLLASVVAAVVASAGLRHLLARLPGRFARGAIWVSLAIFSVADLGLLPYTPTYRVPPMPASYAWLKGRDPRATLLELPIDSSAQRTQWQSLHGLTTSEGYTGVTNLKFVESIFLCSPFSTSRPDFLVDKEAGSFGPIRGVAFRDYAWLFLTTHRYQYVVLHRNDGPPLGDPSSVARLRAELAGARVFEDEEDTIYARSRLATPSRPVMVCTEGWRTSICVPGPFRFGTRKVARLALYNPTPDRAMVLTVDAASVRVPREVRVMSGKTELAHWRVVPVDKARYQSPPFFLPVGLQELTIESDGEIRPRSFEAFDEDRTPLSLRIDAIHLGPANRPGG